LAAHAAAGHDGGSIRQAAVELQPALGDRLAPGHGCELGEALECNEIPVREMLGGIEIPGLGAG
jgi:hypothetical protein